MAQKRKNSAKRKKKGLRISRSKRLLKRSYTLGGKRKARLKQKRNGKKRKDGKRAVNRKNKIVAPTDTMAYSPQPNMRYASGERLNILYLVHCFYPESYTGTEKFVLNMAKSMQNKGHRVKVITYSQTVENDSPNVIGDVVFSEYSHEGIPVLAYKHRLFDPATSFQIGDISLSSFADHVIEQEQPHLIHMGHPMRALEFAQASQRRGIPYVITLTDYWMICPKSLMIQTNSNLCAGPEGGVSCLANCQIANVEERLANYLPILQSASQLFSPSAFLASMVMNVFPQLHIDVLNHGLHYETLKPNKKIYGKRDPITLVYGGSISEHKGVHVLIDAMSLVPSTRLQLRIYGSGIPEYVEALQRKASMDPRISFRGTYTELDLPIIYQECDVAVVPSIWYENYPFALNEALASRIPSITSNIGGMAEKIKDGINGYTFQVGSAWHLAHQIERILKFPASLNTLKKNIRNMPLRSVEEEAYAYEAVYFTHARSII